MDPPQRARNALIKQEPKMFFSNERTFLRWLKMATLVASVGVGFLSFGDLTSRISGYMLVPLGMIFAIYALGTFRFRVNAMRDSQKEGYDSIYGPVLLTLALVASLIVNMVSRLVSGSY
eukprot:Colp12_sorted_trinity150504_noHs@6158